MQLFNVSRLQFADRKSVISTSPMHWIYQRFEVNQWAILCVSYSIQNRKPMAGWEATWIRPVKVRVSPICLARTCDDLWDAQSSAGSIGPASYLRPRALSYYSDLTLSQEFQPMAAQLSMKAAFPLANILATASCLGSKTGPMMLTNIGSRIYAGSALGGLTHWLQWRHISTLNLVNILSSKG